MFGSIGGPELLLIFVLALLLFGPRKLPEIGRTIGKTVAEFRRATQEFRTSLEREVEMEKVREVKSELADPLKLGSGDLVPRAAPIPYLGPIPAQTPPGAGATETEKSAGTDAVPASGGAGAEDAQSGGDGRRSE